MKKTAKRVISWTSALSVMFCSSLTIKAETETTAPPPTTTSSETIVETSDLLLNYYGYCTSSSNELYISAFVGAIDTMAEIGFIDFEIQRSTTGTGNWVSTSYSVSDQIGENARTYSISLLPVDVEGGYYYRACMKAHAKETGWFFPKTQNSWFDTTGVWVPAN